MSYPQMQIHLFADQIRTLNILKAHIGVSKSFIVRKALSAYLPTLVGNTVQEKALVDEFQEEYAKVGEEIEQLKEKIKSHQPKV